MFREYKDEYNPKIDFKLVNLINPKHDVINNYFEKLSIFKRNGPVISEQGRWFRKIKNIYDYLLNNSLSIETFVYAAKELEGEIDKVKVNDIIVQYPKDFDITHQGIWLLMKVWKTKPIGKYSYVLAVLLMNTLLKKNNFIPIVFVDNFNAFIDRMINENITLDSLHNILSNYRDISTKYVDKYTLINKSEVLEIINKNKSTLVEKYNIKKVWLFGSFVRDDATEYSDIDLYVDFSIDLDEQKQLEVKEYLEFIFQRRVDMHIEGKVYERIAPNGKETRELVLDATK